MQPLSGQGAQGGSTGSSSRRAEEPPPAGLDQDPTVISNRAPLSLPALLDSSNPAGRLIPGMRFAQFELLEYVGGGGMGRVFRAMDTALARTVAIKVLSRHQAADPETLARFRNEAQSAARLNHENIVRVYHVGEEDGLPYIVFEFIEGQNIRAMVEQRGGLPLAEAISYTFQIAQALDHAVGGSVVHRDIKPSNVLITRDGRAKLIDMGLARLQKLGDSDPDLTASGVTLGTFDYISPEQARDPRTADVRSDIYSLGCTLFYMLAGRPPFPEGTVLQKLLQHQGEEPPNVREFRPDLPEQISRLLRKMMAKDPRRRFQSPRELIETLVMLAEEMGLEPIRFGENGWARPRRFRFSALQRHLPWLAPLVALTVIILVLDWLVWSPSITPDDSVASAPSGNSESPLPPVAKPAASLPENVAAVPPGKPPGDPPGPAPTGGGNSPPPSPSQRPPGEKGPMAAPPPSDSPGSVAAKVSQVQESATTTPRSKPQAPADGRSAPPAARLGPEALQGGLSVGDPSHAAQFPVAQFFLARGGLNGAVELSPTVTIPAGPPAAPAVTAHGPGVLVVDGVGGGGENAFATLEQACAAADSGDVIELRYNGPRGERPITLNNRKLTIRAAEQFQPSLVFRPLVTDPLKYPRAMFALNGSQVTLLGVSVELDIPRESQAESWSLFELRQAKSTRLDKCVLSIRNASEQQRAYHQEVAFFRITSPPESGVVGSGAPAVPEGTGVSLLDCVVRGEATLLRVHDLRPFQLTWDNGLLVTTERLLVADGGQRAVQPAETVKIELRHLTAVVRSGLCRFDQNESAPRQLPAQIACTNSILLAGAGAALIEQTGIAPADRHRERIDWNGERNFYEGFTTYWTAQSIAPEQPPEPWSFETWLSYWGPQRENLAKSNRVRWNQLPTGDRPVHAHVPADYALSASTGPANPALGAASDARDAGCRFDRLPPMPAPSAAAPAKSETPESPGAKPKP